MSGKQSLYLVRNNSIQQQKLGANQLESGFAEVQGVLLDTSLTMRQQYALPMWKSHSISNSIRKSVTNRPNDVIFSLHSATERPSLEGWVQCWAFLYKKKNIHTMEITVKSH